MKSLPSSEARKKIQRFCAYQERHHGEVRQKLYGYGLTTAEVEEILTSLISDGFLNEERFARAFAGGKFRMKKWGRIKIVNELQMRGLTRNCISAGLKEIDQEDYEKTLLHILEQKSGSLDESNLYVKRDRVSKFAISRGFEPDLVWAKLRVLLPE